MTEKLGQLIFPSKISVYHSDSEEDCELALIIQAVIVLAGGDAKLISAKLGDELYLESTEVDVVILLCSNNLFQNDQFLKDFYFSFRRAGFGRDEKKLVAVSLDKSLPAYRDEEIPRHTHPVALNLLSYLTLNMRNWRQGQLEEGMNMILGIFSSRRQTGRPQLPS